MIKPGQKLLEFAGDHLTFLGLTGNHGRAVKQLERFLPFAIEVKTRHDGFSFLLDALLLMKLLAAKETTSMRMQLPKTSPVWRKGSRYDVAELEAYLAREAAASAALFDKRNGTTYATKRIADSVARASLAVDFPLDRRDSQ